MSDNTAANIFGKVAHGISSAGKTVAHGAVSAVKTTGNVAGSVLQNPELRGLANEGLAMGMSAASKGKVSPEAAKALSSATTGTVVAVTHTDGGSFGGNPDRKLSMRLVLLILLVLILIYILYDKKQQEQLSVMYDKLKNRIGAILGL